MITKIQLEQIRDFAIDLDWNGAFSGKSKGNRHLFRVVKKAKEISSDGVDISIVEAGAWLHDANLEITISGDTLANKDKVIKFLESIGVYSEDVTRILDCVESHDGRVLAKTLEAKIVHDADTLEKVGPLGIIRETWKRSQLGWNTEKIVNHLESHLKKRASKLYTSAAKKKAKELNQFLTSFFQTVRLQINE